MDAPNQPSADQKLQDKADILENNLFSTLSKQNDPIRIYFQINREQFPNPVIIKALLQLFPRINIKGPKIIITLNQLLNRTIPKDSQLKIEKQLLDISGTDNPELSRLSLTLEILMTSKLLTLSIKGTPVIPSRNGAIAKAFFDHKSCPGALSKNGIMDFREINKYPIAKAGDNLFFIIPESQGKPGMGYDGQVIQVPNALALKIDLNGGVEKVDSLDADGNYLGYFLKAVKTVVVMLSRDGNKISAIGISDELEIKRLDYSTGNIGTSFICPISMKIDTICNGFKIRARGMVEANVLEGGEIETDSQAHLHTVQPGSRVTARKDIIVHFARNAVLTSETGGITLLEEVMDSTLCSAEIRFEKNKGVLTSNTLDAETLFLKNIYFCGENTIHFGRRLFSRKQALLNALQALETEMSPLGEQEKESMEKFHHELQRLTKIIKKDPLLLDNLKNLILATRTMDFDTLDKEMETIEKRMNTKEVSQIKNRLESLRQIPGKKKAFAEQKQELSETIKETDQKISGMSLMIEGYLRRAGTLKIHTGGAKNPPSQEPDLFIESEQSQDTPIKLSITYSGWEGFKIIRN